MKFSFTLPCDHITAN
uniref:Uncharacterized protein n=1 Tax=Anguilla anguilla TaxID=7936 RepID=A0A0E9SEE1_ANGAN